MSKVKIGNRWVGDGEPCFVVAEIGINHNGDLNLARKLISAAVLAGCDAVKFQKRTVEVVYTPEELARPRESPFGETNGHLKRGLELGYEAYEAIDDPQCHIAGCGWLNFRDVNIAAAVNDLAKSRPGSHFLIEFMDAFGSMSRL